MSNSWYEVVSKDSPLGQGDLLFDCPLLVWCEESPDLLQGIELATGNRMWREKRTTR